MQLTESNRDYYAGALMLVIGVAAAWQGIAFRVGSLTHMGPGFFPVALGSLLAMLGIGIALGSTKRRLATGAAPRPEWRAWGLILLSVAAFVAIGKYGGLLPATFAIVFISALGDRDNTWRSALALSAVMCGVAVIVFWWLLQLRLPLFGWG